MLENKTEAADLPIQKTLPGLTRNSVLITENELHALVSTYMHVLQKAVYLIWCGQKLE